MSSFLFSTSVTLLLLSILSFSTAYLVDIDGDPILNGGNYYIIRGLSSTSSGLTYTHKKQKGCPLYITKEKTENSPGTPVTISSLARTLYISLGESVSLAFQGPTPCRKSSLEWGTTIDAWARKVYITAGGESAVAGYRFSITKRDRSLLPTYELKYGNYETDRSSFVGLFKDDGLLGLTKYPTIVSFKKAFDVLELPTS